MKKKEDTIILVDNGFRYNIRAEITCPELILLPAFPLHTLTPEKCLKMFFNVKENIELTNFDFRDLLVVQ